MPTETTYVGCPEGGQFAPCRPNHPKCFRRGRTCVYDRVLVDAGRGTEMQTACRDGSHLRDRCGKCRRCLSNCSLGYISRPLIIRTPAVQRTLDINVPQNLCYRVLENRSTLGSFCLLTYFIIPRCFITELDHFRFTKFECLDLLTDNN